jgi:hypothetical protein
MVILNLCLTFHSLYVLFICFINKSILCKSVLYIHFFLKKIQHIQSQYGSHIVPQWRLDELLFAVRTQGPNVTISGLSWACFGRWYGVFEICFSVLLSSGIAPEVCFRKSLRNWIRAKYKYIFSRMPLSVDEN